MLSINSNLMADNAARQLGKNYNALSTSVERLSSGLRINSAKDDAAGLAVRELMRADVAALQQGSRNAADGISLLQTMEGALQVVDDSLVRLKELAEQSATGSYSADQRAIMVSEFAEVVAEIDRIVGATDFNDIKMLAAAGTTTAIHVGSATTIDMVSVDMTSVGLGVDAAVMTIDTEANAALAVAALDAAIVTKDTARATFGYKMNRLESAIAVVDLQAENISAAESRVSDVDVATEMANMTKSQVLAQAGISMLSQANQLPQMAMQLLR